MKPFLNITKKLAHLTTVVAVSATMIMPASLYAQTTSNAPLPPRSSVDVPPPNKLPDLRVDNSNSGSSIITGGAEALEECLNEPLGEFQGIIGGQVTSMAVDFLGAAGLIDKIGNIVADAQTMAALATAIGAAAKDTGIPVLGKLAGPTAVADAGVMKSVISSTGMLRRLQAKIGEVSAEGQADLNETQLLSLVKDNCIDRVVYTKAQQMLYQLSDEAIEWVQSGFEGDNPGFVQNLEQRNRDVAAAEWLQFLNPNNDEFGDVCRAFRADVVRDVRNSYYQSFSDPTRVNPELELSITEERLLQEAVVGNNDNDCKLTEITGSNAATEAFLAGNFSAGGWDAWMTLFNDPKSNPNTASRYLSSELLKEIEQEQDFAKTELGWSGGYLSDKVCEINGTTVPVGFGGLCPNGSEPIIITPGQTVATIINELIVSPVRRLELADEFGEIVEAIGDTLIGNIFPSGGNSKVAGLARMSRRSFSEAFVDASNDLFTGANPEGFTIARLEQQTNIETSMYSIFNAIWMLRNSPGISDTAQCVVGNNELQTSLEELDLLIDSIIPGSISSQQSRRDYEFPGQYKVDWAGNDFEWEYDKLYGETTCGTGTYGNVNNKDERDVMYRKFIDYPKFAFRVPRDSSQWKISICVPTDDGGPVFLAPISYSPPAYRTAENRQKIDWRGEPFEWQYYDPFDYKNAYGIDRCDTDTEGDLAYSVGRSLVADSINNFNKSSAYSGLNTDDEGRGTNWCNFIGDLLGFRSDEVCPRVNSSGNSPETRNVISVGINRAINYLVGSSLSPAGPVLDQSTADNKWYKNRCAIRGEGDIADSADAGESLRIRLIDYYVAAGTAGSGFSPLPRPSSLDILLANIAITLDGLPNLSAPNNIIREVKPTDPDEIRALQQGLIDLQNRINDGEAVSLVAQSFYELGTYRNFHDDQDVTLASNGYRKILQLYKQILEQSDSCQNTPGGGVPDLLQDGQIRVNNVASDIKLPADYDRPLSVSWSSEYCSDVVRVYRGDEMILSGPSGTTTDSSLIGTEGQYRYSLYCGTPDQTNRLDTLQVTTDLSEARTNPEDDGGGNGGSNPNNPGTNPSNPGDGNGGSNPGNPGDNGNNPGTNPGDDQDGDGGNNPENPGTDPGDSAARPELNDTNGLDDDGDGCIDDSYLDPDGSCNNGGNYVSGEDNSTNGLDDDGDGVVDDYLIGSVDINTGDLDDSDDNFPITELPDPSDDEIADSDDDSWWWLWLILIILLIGITYYLIRRRRRMRERRQINDANQARMNAINN